MAAIHQHLRLDDRNDARLLGQSGVTGERVCVHPDAVLARNPVADRDHRTPLGEARTQLTVLGESLAQAVEALGDRLALRVRERLGARVDLDAGNDPFRGEQVRERRSVRGLLPDRLVVEDHSPDVLLGPFGGEQQLAVGAARLLGRFDADRVEPLLDRPGALVRGEDPLAVGDDGPGDLLKLFGSHLEVLPRLCFAGSIA
jgi:hypothetical protein